VAESLVHITTLAFHVVQSKIHPIAFYFHKTQTSQTIISLLSIEIGEEVTCKMLSPIFGKCRYHRPINFINSAIAISWLRDKNRVFIFHVSNEKKYSALLWWHAFLRLWSFIFFYFYCVHGRCSSCIYFMYIFMALCTTAQWLFVCVCVAWTISAHCLSMCNVI